MTMTLGTTEMGMILFAVFVPLLILLVLFGMAL